MRFIEMQSQKWQGNCRKYTRNAKENSAKRMQKTVERHVGNRAGRRSLLIPLSFVVGTFSRQDVYKSHTTSGRVPVP